MALFDAESWAKIIQGYEGKAKFDLTAIKNLDAFTGDVVTDKYLPRYSIREDEKVYKDRLKRAENNYFNFPRKILSIYANSIFRSTEPVRMSDNPDIRRFWQDATGTMIPIGQFVKKRVFLLNQLTGGCCVVVDKPKLPNTGQKLSKAEQEKLNIFPYAYVLPWSQVVNFAVDKFGALNWILLDAGSDANNDRLYKYWAKDSWALLTQDQAVIDSGEFSLNRVPVVRSFNAENPKNNFLTPLGAMDEVVKLSIKIFELMSQLDQMVISHIFLKIAMPRSMYEEMKKDGMGNYNIMIYPDGYQGVQAHYINTPATEMEQMVDLIFRKYPEMILQMATLRDKTNVPREESGVAKFIDSSDELANLIDKAEAMETTERNMTRLMKLWEGISGDKTTISYSKNFDVKSTNEMIDELIQIFKEDLHSPTFSKEAVKRVVRKFLGNVDENTWGKIAAEIDNDIDPALNLEDISALIDKGAIDVVKIAMRYNPDIKTKDDAANFVRDNLARLRAVPGAPSDFIFSNQ